MKKVVLKGMIVLGLGITFGGLSLPLFGQTNQAKTGALAVFPETASVTQHEITLDGKILSYKATTGFLPSYNEKGEKTARMFYTAYTKTPDEKPSTRPLTIAFNGGPGSSSIYLHMAAFGPKVVSLGNGIDLTKPPYRIVDNKNTLLDVTDLVFVDPVGTGFSETIQQNDEKLFWGVEEDIDSMAEFIRLYLTRNERWESSLFIAGESYGGMRASGLSAHLQDMGIYPTGIILISPALSYTSLVDVPGNDIPYIHNVSAMAATAWYQQKIDVHYREISLQDLLQEVRSWSENKYARALWQGNALSETEYTEVARQLAAYTGLSEGLIRAQNLRVPMYQFLGELLEKERRSISFYDGRVTAHSIWSNEYSFQDDPIIINVTGPLVTTFNSYLEQNLRFRTDRKYIPINLTIEGRWDWASGMPAGDMGYPETFTSLGRALRKADFLQVFLAIGLFDMACVHDATIYEIQRMDIPPEALDRITITLYSAGHMVYTDPASHHELKENLVNFYQDALE